MTEFAVEAYSLTKKYGARSAVKDLDLVLDQGKKLAILGANGAGKSSLMRMLATLERPSSGSLSILGKDAYKESDILLQDIAYVSHQSQLYLELSAQENLELFAKLYGIDNALGRIDELLEKTQLSYRRHELIKHYSQGMKQRLAIAKAFLHKPKLLLLDEPYAGLDPQGVAVLNALIAELDEGVSIILISHSPEASYDFADELLVLQEGEKVLYESSSQLSKEEFLDRYKQAIFDESWAL